VDGQLTVEAKDSGAIAMAAASSPNAGTVSSRMAFAPGNIFVIFAVMRTYKSQLI
jgi:hypothetical protein